MPATAGWIRSAGGWLPASLAAAFTLVALWLYGVGVGDLAVFCGYLLVGIAAPGTLLWRALRGGPGPLVSDVVCGAILGYTLEVLTYLSARAVGVPLLSFVPPVATLLAFAGWPRLRRHWRGSGDRVPTGWAWSLAAVVAFVVAWTAVTFYRAHGLTGPEVGSPYLDMPFHLALVGEVKHHLPPTVPYVLGEPLHYHWFVYAEMAATSWATGIEPHLLLLRLSLMPMAILFTVGIALLAGELTGSVGLRGNRGVWWAGPLAVALTFAVPPSPYPWASTPVPDGMVLSTVWISPTQTYGAMLAIPAVLLLMEMLRADGVRAAGAGRWATLTILLAVITGAKATYLPMLLAALVLVVAVRWPLTRATPRAALSACALAATALAFAQLVLFAGWAGGLRIKPFATARLAAIGQMTGLADPGLGGPWPVLLPLTATLFCWLLMGGGTWIVLCGRPRRLADPAVLLCIGILIAGVCATLSFDHPGLSQTFFLNSARPYFACLGVAGLVAAMTRRPASGWWVPAGGLVAGAAALYLLRTFGGLTPPTARAPGDTVEVVFALAAPFLALAAIGTAMYLAVLVAARRRPTMRSSALPAVLLFAIGVGLPGTAIRFAPPFYLAATAGWRNVPAPPAPLEIRPRIPIGALEAGRWLRDHSGPDDLVATNSHCRALRQPACDNRNFWVSAYTERRALVSGWGYTAEAHERSQATAESLELVPYWRPQRLADNDAVFRSPSVANIHRLREQYGVRWLLVDHRAGRPPATLDALAHRRFSAGDCAVYELAGNPE